MSTEAPQEVGPDRLPPEQLSIEPPTIGPRLRRFLLVLVLVGSLTLSGIAVWRFLPKPPASFTLDALQGVYEGMVRSDGTNDASVLLRENASDGEGSVTPAECTPLFETTMLNRFPATAADGVGTYWLGQPAISLFTFRFADGEAAETAYDGIATALEACADRNLTVVAERASTGPVRPVDTTTDNGVRDQLAYSFATSSNTRFAVHVLLFSNTVTWQFRYDTDGGEYAPISAQRLMDGLVSQMRSVLDLTR